MRPSLVPGFCGWLCLASYNQGASSFSPAENSQATRLTQTVLGAFLVLDLVHLSILGRHGRSDITDPLIRTDGNGTNRQSPTWTWTADGKYPNHNAPADNRASRISYTDRVTRR